MLFKDTSLKKYLSILINTELIFLKILNNRVLLIVISGFTINSSSCVLGTIHDTGTQ